MARNGSAYAKDRDAADLVRRLRVNEGLSPEELSNAIRDKAVASGLAASRVSVSGDTIRLVERYGREPGPRVKYAIAFYFDMRPGHIWKRDAVLERMAA